MKNFSLKSSSIIKLKSFFPCLSLASILLFVSSNSFASLESASSKTPQALKIESTETIIDSAQAVIDSSQDVKANTVTDSKPNTAKENCSTALMTTEGDVSGFSSEKKGNKACAYYGVPYAAAPVGDLRWRAPESAPSREKLLQATQFGPDCMQSKWANDFAVKSSAKEISEDCLYLNIWRPKEPGNYPVMVWIHGGALLIGSGAWPIYDGTSLANQQKVVVVTINYRLGAFGYFANENLVDREDGFKGGSAGNYGLMDQIKALAWVKENIQQFSGDADNVSIFGESAGGWSVFTLLTTPASEGLFHKAISQSGGSDASLSSLKAFKIGERLAKKLKCTTKKLKAESANSSTQQALADCLRKAPKEKIVSTSFKMTARCMLTAKIGANFCFMPREDGTLLPGKPFNQISVGSYHKLPFIAGYNSKDPWFLRNSTLDSMEMMSDHPSYLYKFKYKKNFANVLVSGAHGLELPFVFNTLTEFDVLYGKIPLYNEKQEEKAQALISSMQTYWANFARTGNPNLGANISSDITKNKGDESTKQNLLAWPERSTEKLIYLNNEIKIQKI